MAPFGLSIGADKTKVFEVAIQNELMRRGYTTEPDDTMSEYITIMLINNKSPEDILKECISFLGNDVERSFVDWLFEEAARNEASGEPEPASAPPAVEPKSEASTSRDAPSSSDKSRPPPSGPRVFQQAIGQAQASTSPTAQKRTASARSPSPSPGGQGPNKSRRTDAPTGPRAMRDGPGPRGPNSNGPRSLLERVGPARPGPPPNNFGPPGPGMMNGPPGPFPPGMNEMEMAQAMNMSGPNQQMMFQEMMMNHMALMAQMASGMGMLPPPGMMPGMMPPQGGMGMQGGPGFPGGPGMGPGGPRNGPPRPQRGRGGKPNVGGRPGPGEQGSPAPTIPAEVAPQLAAPAPQPASPAPPAFAVPERPQSPTLCKFGQKCTNVHCRWSHASPVATAESGVVLSTEACEAGAGCTDKDCIKSHVSPAVANPALARAHRPAPPPAPAPAPVYTPQPAVGNTVQCRYGMGCTRRDCTFSHPPNHPLHKPATSNVPCRFGSACTRATCTYQHPPDRVLPGQFHKGLTPGAPQTHNKSAVFNKPAAGNGGADLEKKLKALQEEKDKAEQGIRDAEAAKKEGGGDKGVVAAAA